MIVPCQEQFGFITLEKQTWLSAHKSTCWNVLRCSWINGKRRPWFQHGLNHRRGTAFLRWCTSTLHLPNHRYYSIIPFRAAAKAELITYEDKTWSRRASADVKTRFNCRTYHKSTVLMRRQFYSMCYESTTLRSLNMSITSACGIINDTPRQMLWLEKCMKVTSGYLLLLSTLSPQLRPSPPAASASPPPAPAVSGWSERTGRFRVTLLMVCTGASTQGRNYNKQPELSQMGAQNNKVYSWTNCYSFVPQSFWGRRLQRLPLTVYLH